MQNEGYDRCFQRIKEAKSAEWVAIQDMDEYMVNTGNVCWMDILDGYGDAAALAVNWHWHSFTDDALTFGPDHLLMEKNVRMSQEPDRQVKSFVRVNATIKCHHSHYCAYEKPFKGVNEYHRVVPANHNPDTPARGTLRCNHYFGRSMEDYLLKIFRGYGDHPGMRPYEFVEKMIRGLAAADYREDRTMQPAIRAVQHLLGME
jgi:hypothetical protein